MHYPVPCCRLNIICQVRTVAFFFNLLLRSNTWRAIPGRVWSLPAFNRLNTTSNNFWTYTPSHQLKILLDLKTSEDLEEGKLMEEELNTEGMDPSEAALLKRQREVAIKRVRSLCCFFVSLCCFVTVFE